MPGDSGRHELAGWRCELRATEEPGHGVAIDGEVHRPTNADVIERRHVRVETEVVGIGQRHEVQPCGRAQRDVPDLARAGRVP